MHNGRRLSHYLLPQTTNHITLQYLGEPRAAFVGRDTDDGPVNVFVRTLDGYANPGSTVVRTNAFTERR